MNTNNNTNHEVSRQLRGRNNKRLHSSTPVNNAYTEAYFEKEGEYPHSKALKPTLEGVIEAKDWVDNGSRT
ncbi:CDIF630_02480 family spore surface protein [Terrisporobacter sp.]